MTNKKIKPLFVEPVKTPTVAKKPIAKKEVAIVKPKIDKKEILISYFEMFSNKDIQGLTDIFDENITLVDWENSSNGKDDVIKANQNIFNNVNTIRVDVINIFEKEDEFSCQILITINGNDILEVVDVIKFKDNKIISVKAYKG